MSKILSRDEFGIEVTKFNNGEKINEGLLQFLKSFFKQDWKDIKSKNSALKTELEKIDKSLDGFTMLKRSNYDACAQFRQALCDFANDLLDGKLEELEDGKSLKKVVMGIADDKDKMEHKIKQSPELTSILGKNSIKSKALREKLQDSAKAVEDVISKNSAIAPWANAMKRSVKNLINDVIIQKSDDDDKENLKKALDKKRKEDEKWLKEQNVDGFKTQEEKIKELEKFREKTLTDISVTPLKGMDGNKAIDTLISEFNKMIEPLKDALKMNESIEYNENDELNEAKKNKLIDVIKDGIKNDNHFGFAKIIEIIDNNYDNKSNPKKNDLIRLYMKELADIYSRIEGLHKIFDNVPSDAIQAMFVGIAYSVAYGLIGDKHGNDFLTDDVKELLARCCIEKDATIGYSFPLVNDKKPEIGTIYVSLMNQLKQAKDEAGIFNEHKDLLATFKKNIEKLFNEILDSAKKIKEENEKQKEKEAEALKKKEEEENK